MTSIAMNLLTNVWIAQLHGLENATIDFLHPKSYRWRLIKLRKESSVLHQPQLSYIFEMPGRS